MRSKRLNLRPNLSSNAQKEWDRELNNYENAVSQGVQPAGTKQRHIDAAMAASDASGVAFGA